MDCLLCRRKFRSLRGLGIHRTKTHGVSQVEYNERFNLHKKCKKCKKILLENNITGHCASCRDRSGKNNPFYKRLHTPETLAIIKKKNREASLKNWQDKEYRSRVIKGVSKPRREGFGEEQSKRMKQWYKDNPEVREKRRKQMTSDWAKGVIVKNGYSCNSSILELELFKRIKEVLPDAEHKKTIKDSSGRWLFPDILIESMGLIIEFYGDFWHANPQLYREDDVVRREVLAKEIWEQDEKRIQRLNRIVVKGEEFAKSYHVIVVWEKEWREDREMVLRKIDMLLNWEWCA